MQNSKTKSERLNSNQRNPLLSVVRAASPMRTVRTPSKFARTLSRATAGSTSWASLALPSLSLALPPRTLLSHPNLFVTTPSKIKTQSSLSTRPNKPSECHYNQFVTQSSQCGVRSGTNFVLYFISYVTWSTRMNASFDSVSLRAALLPVLYRV